MLSFDKVFRVRIDTELQKEIRNALAHWRKLHSWERPGTFYRDLIRRGLFDYESNPEQTTAVKRMPRVRKSTA